MKLLAISKILVNNAMRRTIPVMSALLMLSCFGAEAQDKPSPVVTPQPVVAIPPDSSLKAARRDSAARSSQSLPQFELERFVITGAASIDLPDVDKIVIDEPMGAPELMNPLKAPRDRSTFDFLAGPKESSAQNIRSMTNVLFQASVGTFLTSNIGLWVSLKDADNFVSGDVQYGSSRAYVPFANRSEGHLGVMGGMTFHGPSEWYDGGMLKGSLGYGSKTYRFFGSATPSVTRTVSDFSIGADYNSSKEFLSQYDGHAGFSVAGVSDSSASVTETRFDIGAGYSFVLGSVPIDSRVGLSLLSSNGSGEGTLPLFEGGLKTHRIWLGNLFLQGAGQFFVTQGMLGQKLARLYPQLEIGYRFLETTVFSVGYLGRVQFNSLGGLLQLHPYLAARSTIRQTDVPIDIFAALETGWSEYLRTRLSARYQSMRDYPLFTEGGRKGFWTTAYFGTTELSTFQADLFAKFTANSYFTLSLAANSSKNSVTNWKVPYVPDVQLDASVSYEPVQRLTIMPTVRVVDRRVPDLYATTRMKAYVVFGLRGGYSLLQSLDVFVDFQNLTNSNYEAWNGYRSTPFVLSAGLSIRW
jgi:hypothetical protein